MEADDADGVGRGIRGSRIHWRGGLAGARASFVVRLNVCALTPASRAVWLIHMRPVSTLY
jgi:hypothetical protein